MKLRVQGSLLFLLLTFASNAYAKEAVWQTIFGTEPYTGLVRANLPEDLPFRLLVSAKGSFYVAGTNNLNNGNPRPGTIGTWLARFDQDGKQQWLKFLPLKSQNHPLLIATPNDGILVAEANADETGATVSGTRLLQIAPDGSIASDRLIAVSDFCDSEEVCVDGGTPVSLYRAGGEIRLISWYYQPDLSAKPNANGGVPTVRRYFISSVAGGRLKRIGVLEGKEVHDNYRESEDAVQTFKDGRLFVLESRAESYRVTVTAYSPEGRLRNTWEYDARTYRSGASIVDLPNGEILISHLDQGVTPASTLLRIDSKGKIVSRKQKQILWYFGSMEPLPDGNYLTVGSADDQGEGHDELVKMNLAGDILARKKIGGPGTSVVDFAQLPSGDIVILCYTRDYGAYYIDGLLMKADANWNFAPPPRRP